jgi:DNA-binding transcriptional LysR family regulator
MFMVKLAHELGHRLDVRVQVSRFGTVAGLVAAGVGIGIIPRSIFLDAGKGFQAVKLDEPWAARRLSVCVRCDIGAATPTDLLRRHLAKRRGT